jgi:sigma-B regulation protein RsbU (phosphoserine phosphatase)
MSIRKLLPSGSDPCAGLRALQPSERQASVVAEIGERGTVTQRAFIVADNDKERRRVPVGEGLTIGRGAQCSLVIRDSAASRQHLEIKGTGSGYTCRDLGSRNGTLVNGERIETCELVDGDKIRIGETVLNFEVGDAKAAGVPEKTMFLQTVLDPSGREQKLPPSSLSQDFLEAAYTLMNAMASNFNPCELVDIILRTTMDAIRAHRGAVLFAGPDDQLLPCAVCGKVHTILDGAAVPATVDEIEISETVARRVLHDEQNVLFQSGWSHSTIDPTVSMAALNLTSILCVPIRTQDSISGILYIDTNIVDHVYTQDDLLLAAAAGNSAGLALQNAYNHQALLRKQRIEQDVEAAWTIQEGFLVSDWSTGDPRFEIYGRTRPARIVGGDFYDFVRIDGDRVGMLIGDVSGKGMAAALTMAQILAEFRLCAPGSNSPADVLRQLNDRLVVRSQRGMFCTIAAVAINLENGNILGANAGHHPMVVVSRDRSVTLLEASGPPIGILAGASWADERATVAPGDTMLFYTDGIVEARAGVAMGSGDGELVEYGVEKLMEAAQNAAAGGPQRLIEAVIQDVDRFCSPLAPHDDCTLIALRYNGDG